MSSSSKSKKSKKALAAAASSENSTGFPEVDAIMAEVYKKRAMVKRSGGAAAPVPRHLRSHYAVSIQAPYFLVTEETIARAGGGIDPFAVDATTTKKSAAKEKR